jgi:hypothetical protein
LPGSGSYTKAGAYGERSAGLCLEENSMASRLVPRSCRQTSTLRSVLGAVCGCALAAAVASGCGTAADPAAASGPASPSPNANSYLTCLRQHGASIPVARPTVRPTAFPSGGFGAANPAMQKARQACASLRPKGGFGRFGGGGRFAAAFQAFRSCMASHGEAIPATRPTAPPTPAPSPGTDRFLNGLNPSNPKVAAALKACQSKLPTFGSGAG